VPQASRDYTPRLHQVAQLLQRGNPAAALALCHELMSSCGESAQLQVLTSQAYEQLGEFDAMLRAARRAVALRPGDIGARIRLIEAEANCGGTRAALTQLAVLEQVAGEDHRLVQHIAELYLRYSQHVAANRCYRRSAELVPRDPRYLHNLAASSVALGRIDEAEALFTRVIELDPADFGAYQSRSALRTWGAKDNHLTELLAVLQGLPDSHAGQIPLCHAIAKEYEDLGEFNRSFEYLERGARRRRAALSYRVGDDIAVMERIAHAHDAALLQRLPRAAPSSGDEVRPVFVLGLPRSGTTLVDRILSSHNRVSSLGEINDLALALVRLAAGPGGKLAMVDRSAMIDFAALGKVYLEGATGYGEPGPWLIDKMPLNFLYIGLIHLAVPGARVIHVRRHPLASCHAIFKTLFRMGYPYSYSLEDIGHYYVAYHRLMAHWRATIPDSFLDLDYEQLVDDQEAGTRRLLEYCGLEWQHACLEFHRNASPAATASAVQVRRPIYRSSLERWRRYERQLAPLAHFLTEHGIDCG
jgi:tetratricopeptide (TPR) repeat protein